MADSVVEIIIKATNQSSDVFKKATSDWKDLSIGINQALELAGKIGDAFEKAFDYTRSGADILQTEKAFASLLSTMDMGPEVLREWRKAAGGVLTEMELMTGFQTLAAGMTTELTSAFAENNAKLLEISKAASALNPKLGDTAYMYESITAGIKRSSPLILDNLGILVKVGDANEAYAKSLGKTVEELSAEERQMALLNAVMESGDTLIQQLGGSVDAATDPWDRFTTAMGRSKDTQASMIAQSPALAATLNLFSGFMDEQTDRVRDRIEIGEILRQALALELIDQKEYGNELKKLNYSTDYNTDLVDELSDAIEEMAEQTREAADAQLYAAEQAQIYTMHAELMKGATLEEAAAVAGLSEEINALQQEKQIKIEADTAAAMAELEKLQEKMENDLSRAMEVLVSAQEDWKSSLAADLVQGLQDAGMKGDEFVQRLDAIDKALGTSLGAEHRYEVAYDLEMPELLQSLLDDPDQFVKDAAVFVDYFMPLEQSVANAQAKVEVLQSELNAIIGEYDATIVINTIGSIPDLQDRNVTYTATYRAGRTGTTAGAGQKAGGGPIYPGNVYRWREFGDEYLMSDERGYVVPQRELGANAGGEPSIVVNINTPINFADRAWVERELAPYIRKEMREALRT